MIYDRSKNCDCRKGLYNNMYWIEAVIHTTTEGIEPVSGQLLMCGISGFAIEDSEDFKSFLEGDEVYYDYIEDDLLKLKECETTIKFWIKNDVESW